jgi:hypothetical protein
MAGVKTITAANSQLFLSVAGLYTTPLPIMGYATDNAFQNEAIVAAEASIGVDGLLSAGYIFNPVKQKITLSPDSPSKYIFDGWYSLMYNTREIVFANATLILLATQETYTFTKGVLTTYHGAPTAKKVLQPVEYEITWQAISNGNF